MARHVHVIANSGRQQEICAFKIWRERNRLEFPSLYLELMGRRAAGFGTFRETGGHIEAVRLFLGNRFEEAMVCDPVNTTHVVSNDLSEKEKKAMAKAARDALYEENWKKVLG